MAHALGNGKKISAPFRMEQEYSDGSAGIYVKVAVEGVYTAAAAPVAYE